MLALLAGPPAGRRTSLSAACLLTNRVRVMLRATGPATSCGKKRDSMRRPASIGTVVPS